MIRTVTLAADPKPMTAAQFRARQRKMRETWDKLTPVQQARWSELRHNIEQMADLLQWLEGLRLGEPVTECHQMRMEGTK